MANWKPRYEKGNKLHDLLTDVEEKADVHGVSDEELLRGISGLMDGAAKTWYRNTRNTIVTWRQFKRLIKAAFTPTEDDDEVMEKINNLTQEEDESYTDHVRSQSRRNV